MTQKEQNLITIQKAIKNLVNTYNRILIILSISIAINILLIIFLIIYVT
jgi:hypothetical protein